MCNTCSRAAVPWHAPGLPPAPRGKNAMEHLGHEFPVGRLQERVEVVVVHLVHLPEVHKEPQAAALEPRQPVQVRRLQPLQHVARVDVFQQALVAGLPEVADVVLVGGAEERQPVRQELLAAAHVAVDVAEEGAARVQGHVGDVHGGELLLPQVVREHAPEHRRPRRQDRAVRAHAAVRRVDGDVGEDVLVQHPSQGRQGRAVRALLDLAGGPNRGRLPARRISDLQVKKLYLNHKPPSDGAIDCPHKTVVFQLFVKNSCIRVNHLLDRN
uniref:Uncharacterized protein n=1 Tax=Zea mays TaxID=4577 RepID=C0HGY3_MAIZE|nr:unknown [Zea mays]